MLEMFNYPYVYKMAFTQTETVSARSGQPARHVIIIELAGSLEDKMSARPYGNGVSSLCVDEHAQCSSPVAGSHGQRLGLQTASLAAWLPTLQVRLPEVDTPTSPHAMQWLCAPARFSLGFRENPFSMLCDYCPGCGCDTRVM